MVTIQASYSSLTKDCIYWIEGNDKLCLTTYGYVDDGNKIRTHGWVLTHNYLGCGWNLGYGWRRLDLNNFRPSIGLYKYNPIYFETLDKGLSALAQEHNRYRRWYSSDIRKYGQFRKTKYFIDPIGEISSIEEVMKKVLGVGLYPALYTSAHKFVKELRQEHKEKIKDFADRMKNCYD